MFRVALAVFLAGSLGVAALAASPAQGIDQSPERVLSAAIRQAIGAPARADLGGQAMVRLDGDLLIIPLEPGTRLLNVLGRAVPDGFLALLVGSEGMATAGTVRFVPAGFVDSDGATAWTPDDMLASLRRSVEDNNPARVQQGLQELDARRWVVPPSYDPERHQISWAAMIIPKSAQRGSDGEVTFHAIGFGREGYIELSVVAGEQAAESVKAMMASFLKGLNFNPGKAYLDTQPTDRRSPDGLAGAMGIRTLVKADTGTSLWSSDKVMPIAGGSVASIGLLALIFNIHRQMRRNSRRI